MGREEIFGRALEVLGRARSLVLVQVWAKDAPMLRTGLEEASRRGVRVAVVAYGDPGMDFAKVYLHEPGPDEIEREYGGRWLILSVDGREIVAGIVSMGKESRAAWSSHPGIAMPITEQIKHDIYVAEMLERHREVLEASFGPSLRDLRARLGPPPSAYKERIHSE
jgi:HTH-type transcriptional regulator, sugar sensing transcriptional regulator